LTFDDGDFLDLLESGRLATALAAVAGLQRDYATIRSVYATADD